MSYSTAHHFAPSWRSVGRSIAVASSWIGVVSLVVSLCVAGVGLIASWSRSDQRAIDLAVRIDGVSGRMIGQISDLKTTMDARDAANHQLWSSMQQDLHGLHEKVGELNNALKPTKEAHSPPSMPVRAGVPQ